MNKPEYDINYFTYLQFSEYDENVYTDNVMFFIKAQNDNFLYCSCCLDRKQRGFFNNPIKHYEHLFINFDDLDYFFCTYCLTNSKNQNEMFMFCMYNQYDTDEFLPVLEAFRLKHFKIDIEICNLKDKIVLLDDDNDRTKKVTLSKKLGELRLKKRFGPQLINI